MLYKRIELDIENYQLLLCGATDTDLNQLYIEKRVRTKTCGITIDILKQLRADYPDIKQVVFENEDGDISEDLAKEIMQWKQLNHLSLSLDTLSDAAADIICRQQTIQSLTLSLFKHPATDQEIENLLPCFKKLITKPNLTELSLQSKIITRYPDDKAVFFDKRFLSALDQGKQLRALHIEGPFKIPNLTIDGYDAEALSIIGALNLHKLSIKHARVNGAIIKNIIGKNTDGTFRNPQLSHLDLENNAIWDRDVQTIVDHPNIINLNLSNNGFNLGKGFTLLAKQTRLTGFAFSGNTIKKQSLLKLLENNKRLEILDIKENSLRDTSLENIIEALQDNLLIHTLNLGDIPRPIEEKRSLLLHRNQQIKENLYKSCGIIFSQAMRQQDTAPIGILPPEVLSIISAYASGTTNIIPTANEISRAENAYFQKQIRLAIKEDSVAKVGQLLEQFDFLTQEEKQKYTAYAFIIALANNSNSVIKHLIDNFDINANTKINAGERTLTPFFAAYLYNNLAAIQYFHEQKKVPFESAATTEINGITPINQAVLNGDIDSIQYLLESYDIKALNQACMAQNSGQSLLFSAVLTGNVELVNLLINAGLKIRQPLEKGPYVGLQPIHACIIGQNTDLLARLMELIDPDDEFLIDNKHNASCGASLLWFASSRGCMPVVKELVEKHHKNILFTINSVNFNGLTPFAIAAANGHTQVVTYYYEQLKLNPFYSASNRSRSPYSVAKKNNQPDVLAVVQPAVDDLKQIQNKGGVIFADLFCGVPFLMDNSINYVKTYTPTSFNIQSKLNHINAFLTYFKADYTQQSGLCKNSQKRSSDNMLEANSNKKPRTLMNASMFGKSMPSWQISAQTQAANTQSLASFAHLIGDKMATLQQYLENPVCSVTAVRQQEGIILSIKNRVDDFINAVASGSNINPLAIKFKAQIDIIAQDNGKDIDNKTVLQARYEQLIPACQNLMEIYQQLTNDNEITSTKHYGG